MSVHISCPGCGITLSFGQTDCPVCEHEFPCRESDIIYDSEGYRKDPEPDTRSFEEQIKDMDEFDEHVYNVTTKDTPVTEEDFYPKEFDKDAM